MLLFRVRTTSFIIFLLVAAVIFLWSSNADNPSLSEREWIIYTWGLCLQTNLHPDSSPCWCWELSFSHYITYSATWRWKKLMTLNNLMHFAGAKRLGNALLCFLKHLHPFFFQLRNGPGTSAIGCTGRSAAGWAQWSAAQPCPRRYPPCHVATAAPRPNMTADR